MQPLAVEGTAWFDHQWGDFISVGGGGWDWFAVNLDDGTDLTLSLVRAADGSYPLVYGTSVRPDGTTEHLGPGTFSVEPTGSWTSPTTGATYPSGWRLQVPGQGLDLTLTPTLEDQELDTRATTGVVYWEGSQRVTGDAGWGSRRRRRLRGADRLWPEWGRRRHLALSGTAARPAAWEETGRWVRRENGQGIVRCQSRSPSCCHGTVVHGPPVGSSR